MWFCFDGESFATFKTEDEARDYASDAIGEWRTCAGREWPEEVHNVCWGKVIEVSVERRLDDLDIDPPKNGYWCEFDLVPVGSGE